MWPWIDRHRTVPVKTNVSGTALRQRLIIVALQIHVSLVLLIVAQQVNHIVRRLIHARRHVLHVLRLLRVNSRQVLISHIFLVALSIIRIHTSAIRFHQAAPHELRQQQPLSELHQ